MAKPFKRVVVIGLGGIWSYLRPILCRTLTYTKDAPKNMVMVDYDVFARSNLERQEMFPDDEAKLKVTVHGERVRHEFPALKVTEVKEFVTKKKIKKLIKDGDLVLSCVDNQATRKLLAQHVRGLKNVALVSGANDEDRGNGHLQLVLGGKELTKGMDECHDNVANPKDKNPGELSCEERARLPGGGQTAVANMWSAAIMAHYIWQLIKGGGKQKELANTLTKSEAFYNLSHLMMDATSRAKVAVIKNTKKEKRHG
jgi:hypothetical protein